MWARGRLLSLSIAMALVMWPAALFLELALLMREKFIGPEQSAVAQTLDDLAGLTAQDRRGAAEPRYRRADKPAIEHPLVAKTLIALARHYRARGRPSAAEPLFRRALTILDNLPGPHRANLADGLESYAALLRDTGRRTEAEGLESRAADIRTHG